MSKSLREQLGDEVQVVEEKYRSLYEWMVLKGKNPRREKGLREDTAEDYLQRLDQLHRFTLQYIEPEDPTRISDDQADTLLQLIDWGEITQYQGRNRGEEYSENAKRKFSDALKMYFKWRYHSEKSIDYEWEPKINFSDGRTNSTDPLTYRELGLVFKEAESYAKLPSYYDTPPEEREDINALVAQRLGIPKERVTRKDWLQADWSAKVYSLILVAHDAGLTAKEVGNMVIGWYYPKENTLRIPSEKACKEREKETVGLSDQAANALDKWLQERRLLSKYDGTDKVWLNREENPYKSPNLCRLLRKLCRQAGIKIGDRKIVWYSLRKSMGNKVTDEGDLSEANDQLRHKNLETTQQSYNKTPIEKRRARLNEAHRKADRAANNPEYNPFEDEMTDESESTIQPSSANVTRPFGNEEVVTELTGGDIHIDARIPDTTEAKVDVTRKILDEDSDD